MAPNYRMSARRKREVLHLRLTGDFDGTSAYELLHFLAQRCHGIAKVVIHTDGLREIHPFGRDTFQGNLCLLNNRPIRLEFAGRHAAKIAPERNKFS